MKTYLELEQMLLIDEVNAEVYAQYPESCDTKSLAVQLEMFWQAYLDEATCVCAVQQPFKKKKPDQRALFVKVEQVVRLLLICLLSSCSAKLSFSALMRL